MKESEQTQSNIEQTTFMKAATDLPRSVWLSQPNGTGRGLGLETLQTLFFVPVAEDGVEREATGAELAARYQNFRFKNRLDGFVQNAFANLENAYPDPEQKASGLDHIYINGQNPSQLWGEKYASVTDPAQKHTLFQLELMQEILSGQSQITATDPSRPGTTPVEILPAGGRTPIRREASPIQSTPVEEEVLPEDDLSYSEPDPSPAPAPTEPERYLTQEDITNYASEIYGKVRTTNPGKDIAMPAFSMVDVMMHNRTGDEIAAVYPTLPYKEMLDRAIEDATGLFDSPQRSAFLKSAGVNPMDTIHIDGKTPAELWGEKYKNVQDPALKDTCYKMELIHSLGDPKGDHELSVDVYTKRPFGFSFTTTEPTKLSKIIPVRENSSNPFPIDDEELDQKEPTNETALPEDSIQEEVIPEEFDEKMVPQEEFDQELAHLEDEYAKETARLEAAPKEAVNTIDPEAFDASIAQRSRAITSREPLPVDRWKPEAHPEAIPIVTSPRKAEDTPEQVDANWEMVKFMNDLHNDLSETYEKLAESHKEVLGVSQQNTSKFNKMMAALRDCVKSTDPNTDLGRVGSAKSYLKTYQEAAQAYYQDRKGILFGPATDVGKLRLKEAKKAADTINGTIAKMTELNKKVHPPRIQGWPVHAMAERAITQGALLGKNLSVDDLPGAFGDEFREAAAAKVLEGELMHQSLNTLQAHIIDEKSLSGEEKRQMMMDLSLDNDFINCVETYPRSYEKKWAQIKVAKEILNNQGNRNPSWGKLTDLIENPEFVNTFKAHQNDMPQYWNTYLKAKEYLHQTGAADLSPEATMNLADNKRFRSICEEHPEDFITVWKHTEAAKAMLPEDAKNKQIDALAQNPDFVSLYERFPESYKAKWDLIQKAKDCLDPDAFADPAERNTAAENLAQNPGFLKILSEYPDTYQKEWERFTKTQAYLQEKNGAEPTGPEVEKLLKDPTFAQTMEQNPQTFGSTYEEMEARRKAELEAKRKAELEAKRKAELEAKKTEIEGKRKAAIEAKKAEWEAKKLESVAKALASEAKQQLENLTSILDPDTPLWKSLRNDYDEKDVPNEAYDKGMEALAEKKEVLKDARHALWEEKEEMKEAPSEELRQKIAEHQKKLDHDTALYKVGKRMLVQQHLMPDYIAEVAYCQALTDPKRGNEICHAIATDPGQKEAILSLTKKFLKSEEGQKLLQDPKLNEMVMEGGLTQKVFSRKEIKPQQNKELEKAPTQKQARGMGL